jgi:hypothetical protein
MATLTPAMTRIMQNARIHLPGALDAAIKLEFFNVMDQFFRESDCWREQVDFTVRTTSLVYEIESDEGNAVVVKLIELVDANDIPVRAIMEIPGEVTLYELPIEVRTLSATVSLTTTDPVSDEDYPVFPDWVAQKYHDAIIAGILSRMMAHPAKPYMNERMGIYHGRRFRGYIAQARKDANQKNLYDGQAWRYPQNFATGR